MKTLEQRPSRAASKGQIDCSASMAEKGGVPMEEKKNTDTPQSRLYWTNIFLVGLHVILLMLSILTHEFKITETAPRALP